MRQFFQKNNKSPFRVIIVGFLLVIITGSLLLMLPIASQQGIRTPFLEALFTSTSAVCVTGLVLHDTADLGRRNGLLHSAALHQADPPP